jgi:acetolactate synthase-1/3 small subunit
MHPERVTFVIQAENRADVLARITLLFHRLNVEIHALAMVRERSSKTIRMSVTVEAEVEHARRLEAHLYKVIEVRSVNIEWARAGLGQEALV